MSDFTYTLKSHSGTVEHGHLDADSVDDAAKAIAREGWFITSLSDKRKSVSKFELPFLSPMTAVERIVFTDHLAEMISSGTPVVEALETYKEEENKKTAALINDIVSQVRQGKRLSDALLSHPEVFTPYYAAVVHAGELTGRMDESFHYIAKELRREYEFAEKIKSAMLYPSLVLVVAVLVILLLVFFVVPKITDLTKSFGGELPLATKIVSGAATFISAYGGIIIVALFGLGALITFLLRVPETKKRLEPHILHLPIFGLILRHYQLARFLRILGSSVEYGIALSTACDMVAQIVKSSVYKEAAMRLKDRITKGVGIAEALGQEDPFYFPSFIIRSLKGAEKTGSLSKSLQRIATFYENDVDRNLQRMTELIQPILTIILGLVVGAIALSVVAPIYQITSKIR